MDDKAVGKRIKEHRLKIGLTQEKLAEKLDISTNHLSAVERGAYSVKLDLLVRMANIFGCSADELLEDVLEHSYHRRSCEIDRRLESVSNEKRSMILDVMETMLRHSEA